jgi:hypothetical protein
MKTPAPSSIPTGLRPKAQGCARRATLGHAPQTFPQPQRGCVHSVRARGHNPVGVDSISPGSPRVARASQPWADSRYPVGVNQPVTNCHRLKISPNPCAESRQSVTNCHRLNAGHLRVSQLVTISNQLKTGCLSITQPVTNCYQLKAPTTPCKLIPPP